MSRIRQQAYTGQFAGRLVEMLESPAFRVLSLSAHRVIHRIEIELAHHAGHDNGRLPVTFSDFETYGIHRHAIAPAIREAAALGFIEVTGNGRAGNAEYRAPNYFRLTFKPSKGVRGDGSHEWRNILEEEAEAIANAARRASSKTKSQCRKTPVFGDGFRHRKPQPPVPVSATTEQGAFSDTTIYISGRGA